MTAVTELADLKCSFLGFFITVAGVVLAGLKAVMTNKLMVNSSTRLHPVDLLAKTTPVALILGILCAALAGELVRMPKWVVSQGPSTKNYLAAFLALNGSMAFFLNWISFVANRYTSPLTMAVAANLKQALSVILAIKAFNTAMSPINASGMIITLIGAAWYSLIVVQERQMASAKTCQQEIKNESNIIIDADGETMMIECEKKEDSPV